MTCESGLDAIHTHAQAVDAAATQLMEVARQLTKDEGAPPLFASEALLLALIRIQGPLAYSTFSSVIPRKISLERP